MTGLLVAAVLILAVAVGCGSSSADHSTSIAAQIGANASCTLSDYGIVDKESGKKTPIYDCTTAQKTMCVTESNGLVQDVTALARVVFASSLSGKPDCATG